MDTWYLAAIPPNVSPLFDFMIKSSLWMSGFLLLVVSFDGYRFSFGQIFIGFMLNTLSGGQ